MSNGGVGKAVCHGVSDVELDCVIVIGVVVKFAVSLDGSAAEVAPDGLGRYDVC